MSGIIFICLLLVTACPLERSPRLTEKPTDTMKCGIACDHMASLGCKQAQPIPIDGGSVSCKTFCEETQATGVWLNPSCVEKITKCEEIENVCYVGKQRR